MRELYDRLVKDGETVIDELINKRRQEAVDLDFKLKKNNTTGELSRDDIINFGKELAAFSNSAGGVIVWGVEAKKAQGDDVDCARAKLPIADIERFESEMRRCAGDLLMPRHDGIEIAAIPSATKGSGYLAVYVERSERRPHRSEASGDKRYYKRASNQTLVMEHYDVEDAFKRMVVASLELHYQVKRRVEKRAKLSYLKFSIILYLEKRLIPLAPHPQGMVEHSGNMGRAEVL
jgi:predicted HTH transcriptional regulator